MANRREATIGKRSALASLLINRFAQTGPKVFFRQPVLQKTFGMMSFNLKANTQHFQSHGVIKIILWESTCWQVISSFVGIPKNQKRTSGKGFNGYSQSGSIHTGTSRSQGQMGLPADSRKASP